MMATRVSPRSNTSSASSSSAPSSSRRAYRNPSFGKACGGGFGADPWASDARSAYSASKQQQQQHGGGQWGQKPYRDGRCWRDPGPLLAKESENASSWRSQKPAVDRVSSFLDTGQSSGSHRPGDRMYEAPRFPAQGLPSTHAPKSQWSQASPRHQNFNAQQSRPYLEEASWSRQQPSFARQNHEVSSNFTSGKLNLPILNADHNQGYMPDDRINDNSCWNSTFNRVPEISCVSSSFQQIDRNYRTNPNLGSISSSRKPLKESDYTAENPVLGYRMEAEVLRGQASHREHMYANATDTRAIGAKSDNFQPLKIRDGSRNSNQEYKNYSQNLNHESVVYLGKASQGSVSSTEGSTFRRQGEAKLHRDSVCYRGHSNLNTLSVRGAGIESNHFQSFSIGDGDMVSTPHLSMNRQQEGMVPSVTSWADECCDNDLQTCEVAPKYVYNTHKTERVDCDVPVLRRIKDRNLQNLDARVVNTNASRQNERQVAPGTKNQLQKANIGSKQVKQGQPNTRSVHVERKGSTKHLASVGSEHVAHKAGESGKVRDCSRNDNSLGSIEGDQEVSASVNPVHTSQAETDVTEDGLLPFVMGTCDDMCPLKERQQRERLRDLAVFERVNRNPSKTSKELAVKKFCRTLTGVKLLSDDVRPLRVLWSTQQYLLNLLDDTEFPFNVVHDFLFDRTRAIRQELGMQRIANSQAINMYEEIVRFHILSEHELNQRGSGRHALDSHLNLQQLSKSLLSLFDLYRLHRNGQLPNEAEFRAYYILLNLDSIKNHQADSLSVWFRQFPVASLKSWEVKFARAVLRCYGMGDYRTFSRLVDEATFLQSCLMELHFNEVRLKCLVGMNQGGYKLHPIPLSDIARQLLMKEGDLEELCNLCGLSTGMDSSKVRVLFVKQSQFTAPKELPSYRCPCIVNKRPTSYFEEVTGRRQRL